MRNKNPICGILSVVLPLVGLLVGLVGSAFFGPEQPAAVAVIVSLSLLCPVSGVVISVIGMVRHERLRWLPVFGFVWSIGWALSYFAA